jgi:predicted glycoside hydrolase/deacetylase ChbG (UPF0249 family)
MNMSRRLILNADDVGMHPTVDAAVLRLAESGILSSASVMVMAQPDADVLRILQHGRIDLGLHLDLSSETASRRYGLPSKIGDLLMRAYSGRLDQHQMHSIIAEQLQRFCELTGRTPTFIDGHEHVHQFPSIRDALLQALAELPENERPFLRNTKPRHWRGPKAAVIGVLGASTLATRANKLLCVGNTDFFGVYPLQHEVELEQLWHCWLRAMPAQGALAMCHPATAVFAADNAFRLREYLFLSGPVFAQLRRQYNVSIVGWHAALDKNADTAAFCAG